MQHFPLAAIDSFWAMAFFREASGQKEAIFRSKIHQEISIDRAHEMVCLDKEEAGTEVCLDEMGCLSISFN